MLGGRESSQPSIFATVCVGPDPSNGLKGASYTANRCRTCTSNHAMWANIIAISCRALFMGNPAEDQAHALSVITANVIAASA